MMYSVNQSLARLDMRATASAIVLFIINIVGAGAGPLLVGLLSDLFAAQHGVLSIRYALAVTVTAMVAGYACFALSSRHFSQDLARARANP
jgi:hypothetical protein